MYETITLDLTGGVALLSLNRPSVLNALNGRMLDELRAAFTALEADRGVRAGILTRAGEKAVAAGADIAELNAIGPGIGGAAQARRGDAITLQMERLRVPIIAAVNGFALGGGCELAAAADIRIASENAKFGQPEVNLGLLPGYGGTQRLQRLVGRGWAMYLCLSAEMIDAAEALRIGLVQKVVPLAGLHDEATRIAQLIAAKAPLAVSAAKRAIDEGAALAMTEALALEALQFGQMMNTRDYAEGTKAFLEKRKPNFTGT
jgi:enoyl-CoA hydratase